MGWGENIVLVHIANAPSYHIDKFYFLGLNVEFNASHIVCWNETLLYLCWPLSNRENTIILADSRPAMQFMKNIGNYYMHFL